MKNNVSTIRSIFSNQETGPTSLAIQISFFLTLIALVACIVFQMFQLETYAKSNINTVSKHRISEGFINSLPLMQFKPKGEEVMIPNGDSYLVGNLHGPKNTTSNKAYPLVLLLHGLGGDRFGVNGYHLKEAKALANQGMIVLRIDFRGHGESSEDLEDISLTTLVEDANSSIEFLKDIKQGDANNISIVGFSLGGTIAAMVASNNEGVRNLVILESPYSLVDTFKKFCGPEKIDRVIKNKDEYLELGKLKLSHTFMKEFNEVNMDKEVSGYTGNVLLIYGTSDQIVAADNASSWLKSFGKAKVMKSLVPSAGHAFLKQKNAKSAIKTSTNWLQDQTRHDSNAVYLATME